MVEPTNWAQFVDDYEQALEDQWSRTRIAVMVFGPNLASSGIGARLRKFIIGRCADHGIAVTGEHTQLADIYQKIVGSGRNLCTMEVHAANRVDAVIMLPASAGSLVELGMFALSDTIAPKTLILFQDKHAQNGEPSFIHAGPQKSYTELGAKLEYVNYRKTREVWNIVDEFLRDFRVVKFNRILQRPDGTS